MIHSRGLARPGIALAPHVRVVVVLTTLLIAAGCGGTTSPSVAPVSQASIGPTPTTAAPSASTVTKRTAAPTAKPEIMLVAVGDSIPFNSKDDCPGCTGFVDRFADDLRSATGKTVAVRNLSQHNGLQVQGLVWGLRDGNEQAWAVADADVIIVGIAHNDTPWNVNSDACDGAGADPPDWSKFSAACIATEVKRYTPKYEAVFERIAALRASKPTVLRAINRYNDWNGWPGHPLPPEGVAASAAVIAAWNKMICGAAEANGFTCADISTAFNGKDGTQPSGELLAGDYTHPSDKGNEVIADVLVKLGFKPLAP
jgi:lysophospholipase L1-like esterase